MLLNPLFLTKIVVAAATAASAANVNHSGGAPSRWQAFTISLTANKVGIPESLRSCFPVPPEVPACPHEGLNTQKLVFLVDFAVSFPTPQSLINSL